MTTKTLATLSLALALGITSSFAQTNAKDSQKNTQVFRFVDQQAEPKGGMHHFEKYLVTHVRYPKLARENNIHGRVLIQFVVNEDGKLSDVAVLKDIGAGCGEEVRKIIKECPYIWTPAKSNGNPVKSYFTMPFTFGFQ